MKRFLPLLLLAFLLTFPVIYTGAQDCSDLFISEYVEGWSNNKALEIYNPTSNLIDLSLYRITRYSNGAAKPVPGPVPSQWYIQLSGTLKPYHTAVFVIDKRDPEGVDQEAPVWYELQSRADQFLCPVYDLSYALYFNGDDCVVLEKVAGETEVDIFGKRGERPTNETGGTSSPTGGWSTEPPYDDGTTGVVVTRDHTMTRKVSVLKGVTVNPEEFNPMAEWDTLPANTFTSLNWHDCHCRPAGNHKPVFDPGNYSFTISINDPDNTVVGTVSATDQDNDPLSYFISGGNPYDPFMIDRETGEIKVFQSNELYWASYTLTVDVTDGTEPVSVTVDITVEGGAIYGIPTLDNRVSIYPNPVTNGWIDVGSMQRIKGISVYNLTGRELLQHIPGQPATSVRLNLGSLRGGMYFMKVRVENGPESVRKIIVN